MCVLASIARLGERQTEDLKVADLSPACGIVFHVVVSSGYATPWQRTMMGMRPLFALMVSNI